MKAVVDVGGKFEFRGHGWGWHRSMVQQDSIGCLGRKGVSAFCDLCLLVGSFPEEASCRFKNAFMSIATLALQHWPECLCKGVSARYKMMP